MNFKKTLKYLLPPLAVSLYQGYSKYGFRGEYKMWQDAVALATGYNSPVILNKVKDATLKVKSGLAVHERDSVIFDKIEYSWPLLVGMLRAASGGELRVLDFGGSLGTTYWQNRLFINGIKDLQWAVVEQENFVKVGNELLADGRLKFYTNLDECNEQIRPNLIIISSSLQYIEFPYQILDKLMSFNCKYIALDRTPLIKKSSRIVLQKVDPKIYDASYPCWLLNENELVNYISKKYNLLADFAIIDVRCRSGKLPIEYKGFIFEHKIN